MSFDYTSVFAPNLPAAPGRWAGHARYNFIGGHNDGNAIPVGGLIAAAESVLAREGRTLATYGQESGPQGYRPLREFLAVTLSARAGLRDSADDILVVSGSLQALDLVNTVLLSPGDTVIIEEATYGGALRRLERCGVEIVGAPLDGEGIRMDALAATLDKLAARGVTPKYIYTIPTVQNPTGSVMPEARRHELLRLARAHGVVIFEDDCYADLTFDGTRPRAIRALDDGGQVIYCGSFSKTVAVALRIGFLVAEWDVLARMLPAKTDAGTGALEQMVLAEFCAGRFDAHVASVVAALQRKCVVMTEALEAEFGTAAEISRPEGGIVLWVTLPEEVDTTRLAAAALAEGVAINPGAEWTADSSWGRRRLRLCYANPTEDEIREGIAKLADICRRETGIPARSRNVERAPG